MAAKRIMLVDDNYTFRMNIRQMLNPKEYEIIEASRDTELFLWLEKIKPQIPHIFLIDLILPGLNGLEIIAEIKKDARFKTTPIFLVTGRATRDTVEQARALGINELIAKPVNSSYLIEKMEQAIAQDRRSKMMSHSFSTINLMVFPQSDEAQDGTPGSFFHMEAIPLILRSILRTRDSIVEVSKHAYVIVLPSTSGDGLKKVISRLEEVLSNVNKEEEKISWFYSYHSFP